MAIYKKITTNFLDWIYNKTLTGFGGAESAYSLADNYMKGSGNLEQKVNRLIKWQVTKCATSGFVTGFGGFTMMSFSVPANIASVMYLQLRMIAAIAHMGGHNLENDQVRSMIYICIAGNGAKELLKESSIKAGEKALHNVAQKATTQLIEKAGTGISSKIGTKGLSNITKAIPLMGGIIGASFDGITTKLVGNIAKKIFLNTDIKGLNA